MLLDAILPVVIIARLTRLQYSEIPRKLKEASANVKTIRA